VIHRKELSHKNVDGLSYQDVRARKIIALMKLKDAEKQENSVGRIILVEENFELAKRTNGRSIHFFVFIQKKDRERGESPLWQEVVAKDVSIKIY